MVTFKPLACSSFARDAAIMPLPNEEVTPPVTKIYLAIKNNLPTAPLFLGKWLPLKNMTSENLGLNLGGRVKISGIIGRRKFGDVEF